MSAIALAQSSVAAGAAHASQANPRSGADATHQHDLLQLMRRLQRVLQALSAAYRAGTGRRRALARRRLLLGLELVWKIEEQVLFPVLLDAHPECRDDIQSLGREREMLRDLAQLSVRTTTRTRDAVMGVVEGLSTLHFSRGNGLLHRAANPDIAWSAMEREIRGLLGRWEAEVRAHGAIEDEDVDPVGLPPR